jgi:pyruvate dehydrogenase E1 component beta subunit
MTLIEATQAGLAEEMRRDQTVWVLGEDLQDGGVYLQYRGFFDEFGGNRVVSTPISEGMIMNVGLGAAITGTRPVVEIRIADFILCAMDELINQVAKIRFMFGGQTLVPLVVRMPSGLSGFSAAQHSQSHEAWFVHTPGLVVVAPATASDAKGLMKAAIRCDDPVLFFEARGLWSSAEEVEPGDWTVPIGKARVARPGDQVTVVAWSSAVTVALEAAEQLAEEGVSVEVIDLRSLWPWDTEAVLASVTRTGRLVVAHEAVQVGGFGAEICAVVAERLGGSLKGPLGRVGAPRVPVAYSPPLESVYRISKDKVAAEVRRVMARTDPRPPIAPSRHHQEPLTPEGVDW